MDPSRPRVRTPGTAVLSLRDPFPSRFPENVLALAYCRAVAADPQPPAGAVLTGVTANGTPWGDR